MAVSTHSRTVGTLNIGARSIRIAQFNIVFSVQVTCAISVTSQEIFELCISMSSMQHVGNFG